MTLQELRKVISSPDDLNIARIESLFEGKSLLGYAYLSLFSTDYLFLGNAIKAFKGKNILGLHSCLDIAANYNFPAFYYESLDAMNLNAWRNYQDWYDSEGCNIFTPPDFSVPPQQPFPNLFDWCEKQGINLVSVLQHRSKGIDRKSEVILIQDKDGKFKVLKEIVDYRQGPFRDILNEDETLSRLPHTSFLPRFYGHTDVLGTPFLRRSYVYGQSLSHYKGTFPEDKVHSLIQDLAVKLNDLLYKSGLLFLDLTPDNISLQESGPCFIDLGLSRFSNPGQETPIYLSNPRYAAPEMGLFLKASEKSLVYQLGLIAHELMTGTLPFSLFQGIPKNDWVGNTLNSLWPTMALSDLSVDPSFGFISEMLKSDPHHRPSLGDCIYGLKSSGSFSLGSVEMPLPPTKGNCVLFPARMGIPHKGHIDYMSRILDLGYKLVISIQRSYTITDRDPIPKWMVMKMVAQSLMNRGYPKDSFKIILTPFYKTRDEMAMHFAMLPGRENIIAVASSNPEVLDLFPGLPSIEQADVLGYEGEAFAVRSWGALLRGAVVMGHMENFKTYVASGVEKILSLEELKEMYMQAPIAVPVKSVTVFLNVAENDRYFTHVGRYSNPEESLVKSLNNMGLKCELLDLYSKSARVLLNGCERFFVYNKTEPNDGDVKIYFNLK